jgi:hypothetical protein
MANKGPENWLDALVPFPRPEYAKQTEALLTDLLWRSAGSTLSSFGFFDKLGALRSKAFREDPERLVPCRRNRGSALLTETLPLAEATDVSSLVVPSGGIGPTRAVLHSVLAPRSRGDKSDACVPVHPSLVAMQTLHGLVNKESPANLSLAIEIMGWLGGAPSSGHVAASFLASFQDSPGARDGATGALENLLPAVAKSIWRGLPGRFNVAVQGWPDWPKVEAATLPAASSAALADYHRTPFTWFWRKWTRLCDPARRWHDVLPARRYVDWALCLLRTGLAFSYLWEADFFTRLHERIASLNQQSTGPAAVNRLRSMLADGTTLAAFEPPTVPASQKAIWPAVSELLARGWEARHRFYEAIDKNPVEPQGASLPDVLEVWINSLSAGQLELLGAPLETKARTANNQKEFIRYLVLARSSDDDLMDQTDFYYLARTNGRQIWFHPGPEWLVVVTSLLCEAPSGNCTLGSLVEDLACLGVRVDRSVLVGLLEESGLTTDSPDADNALVIRSGF